MNYTTIATDLVPSKAAPMSLTPFYAHDTQRIKMEFAHFDNIGLIILIMIQKGLSP
jgi:hypothetical protein